MITPKLCPTSSWKQITTPIILLKKMQSMRDCKTSNTSWLLTRLISKTLWFWSMIMSSFARDTFTETTMTLFFGSPTRSRQIKKMIMYLSQQPSWMIRAPATWLYWLLIMQLIKSRRMVNYSKITLFLDLTRIRQIIIML